MRIKLNRHVARNHNNEDGIDFLQPGVFLSDDEKEKHFDKLRERFSDLSDKVNTYKNKIMYLKVQLTFDEPKLEPRNDVVKHEKEIVNNWTISTIEHLPIGWKRKVNSKGIISPGGNSFSSIHAAIRHMIKESAPKEDVAIMKTELEKIGWKTVDYLPPGWMIRIQRADTENGKNSWTSYSFLNPGYKLFKTRESCLADMKENGATDEQLRRALGEKWQDDPTLPHGWYSAPYLNGVSMQYINKEGKHFINICRMLQFLHSNNYSADDIEKAKKHLVTHNWKVSENLPPDWFIKVGKYGRLSKLGLIYITQDFKQLKHEEVFDHMLNTDVPQVYIDFFRSNLENNEKSNIEIMMKDENRIRRIQKRSSHVVAQNLDIKHKVIKKKKSFKNKKVTSSFKWQEDKTLPPGWKMTYYTPNLKNMKGASYIKLLSPCGRCLSSRPQALRYMLATQSNQEDVEMMKKGLVTDGWQEKDFLPPGWLFRNISGKTFRILSPDFQTLKQMNQALECMKNANVPEEFIEKFKLKHKFLEIVEKQEEMIQDLSLPDGWSRNGNKIKGIHGKKFGSRAQALRHMLATYGHHERVDIMKSELYKEGWKPSKKMPEGWMARKKICETRNRPTYFRVSYLSPSFELFLTREKAIEYLKKIGTSQSDIEKASRNETYFEKSDKPDIIPKLNEEHQVPPSLKQAVTSTYKRVDPLKMSFDWKEDTSLPPGWKVAYYTPSLASLKDKLCIKLLSPDNKCLNNRPEAMRHMIGNNSSDEDISIMKNLLSEDGWSHEVCLPPGWLCRKLSTGGRRFLTPDYVHLKTLDKVMEFMSTNNMGQESIDKFKSNYSRISRSDKKIIPIDFKKSQENIEQNKPTELQIAVKELDAAKEVEAVKIMEAALEQTDLDRTWKEDSSLPAGWTLLDKMVKNPEGKIFKTRMFALRHMLAFAEPQTSIEHMRAGLTRDGWTVSQTLPKDWFIKNSVGRSKNKAASWIRRSYLSPTFEFFESRERVITILKENGATEEELLKARGQETSNLMPDDVKASLTKTEVKTPSDTYEWLEDESLPSGWKITYHTPSLDSMKDKLYIKLLSPEGRCLHSRPQALRSMLVNQSSQEDLDKMQIGLEQDGFCVSGLIPKGWRLRKGDSFCIFLSPRFETIKSVKKMLEYLEAKGYSQEDKDMIKENFLSRDSQRLVRKRPLEDAEIHPNASKRLALVQDISVEEKTEEEILPDGWKMTKFSSDKDLVLVSPTGKLFLSRRAALEWMVKKKWSKQALTTLELGLVKEGWKEEKELPIGWRVSYCHAVREHRFITTDFKLLHGRKEAELVLGDEEEREQVIAWSRRQRESSVVDGWEEDLSLPADWKVACVEGETVIRDPRGVVVWGRREAIKLMIREHHPPSDIFRLWSCLELEGWEEEACLPTGWRKRRGTFLSPLMEEVISVPTLLHLLLLSPEYKQEEVKAAREGLINM